MEKVNIASRGLAAVREPVLEMAQKRQVYQQYGGKVGSDGILD